MGDDIGQWERQPYNQGMMGYRTPNIDRIGKEGAIIHGLLCPAELHRRTGGVHHGPERLPYWPVENWHARGKEGISAKDPTLAELLKPLGYMTGQFGKNILATGTSFYPRSTVR